MNYEYQCDKKGNVYIKTDVHTKRYKYTDNIEKILVKENVIETLEKKQSDHTYNIAIIRNKLKIIKKLILWSSILIPLLVIPYIIELSLFALIVPFIVGMIGIETILIKNYNSNKVKLKKENFSSIAINKIINKNKRELKVLNRKKTNLIVPTIEEKIVHDREEIKKNLLDLKVLSLYLKNKEQYQLLYKQNLLEEVIDEKKEIIDKIKDYIKSDIDETVKCKIRN